MGGEGACLSRRSCRPHALPAEQLGVKRQALSAPEARAPRSRPGPLQAMCQDTWRSPSGLCGFASPSLVYSICRDDGKSWPGTSLIRDSHISGHSEGCEYSSVRESESSLACVNTAWHGNRELPVSPHRRRAVWEGLHLHQCRHGRADGHEGGEWPSACLSDASGWRCGEAACVAEVRGSAGFTGLGGLQLL